MAQRLNGLAVASATAGFVLLWSGIKGRSIGDTLKSLLKGQNPQKASMDPPVLGWLGGAATSTAASTSTGVPNAQGLVNPIGPGLKPERIDMGVDYGGSGNLYAIGPGTIVNLYNSGWPPYGPTAAFICIHLDQGQYVYYAEDITPLVKVGQKVTAGQVIGRATGGSTGIEVGLAAPPGTGTTAAAAAGQQSKSGDPGSVSTDYGKQMSALIASLGGPAGVLQ